ncbi:MAG: hypothetical protein DBY18_03895 [Clostridia bacterium]|nr:MAG: hypothetical protein DBY18_03895 [Clostridia bacterium]
MGAPLSVQNGAEDGSALYPMPGGLSLSPGWGGRGREGRRPGGAAAEAAGGLRPEPAMAESLRGGAGAVHMSIISRRLLRGGGGGAGRSPPRRSRGKAGEACFRRPQGDGAAPRFPAACRNPSTPPKTG